MDRHVVIGTAGHIDHGKTTLVKALTGVDTDRLAAEKARGITIELGFAPLPLDGVAASIVDVPGHEGFVRTMVAGATGVDLALLAVAADEGVMPQTREHLAILRHLGVTRGVVALTKCDAAPDASWRELVAEEVRAALVAEFGSGWPVCEVSAATGAGLDALRAALAVEASAVPSRPPDDLFRLPVDRVFALAGAGTIVTGTVWSGVVREGDTVTVLPAGIAARVRSVQVHGRSAPDAGPGCRAALALVGADRQQAPRGAVVVAGAGWRLSHVVDVAARAAEDAGLRLRSRVRVHHGTAEVMARVTRLATWDEDDGSTTAGPTLLLRLALEEPLVLRAGDRLVLRSFSPVTTVGGGVVTEPWAEPPPGQRRRREPPAPPPRDAASLVCAVTARRGAAGIGHAELQVAAGLEVSRLTAALGEAGHDAIVAAGGRYFAAAEVIATAERLGAVLDAFHASHQLEPGMSAQAWRAAGRPAHEELVALAAQRMESSGLLVREAGLVRRPGWNAAGSVDAVAAQERILDLLRRADAEPPTAAELAVQVPDADVGPVLRMLVRAGRVVQVADRYYETGALEREKNRLVEALRAGGPASPAEIRGQLGRSRKWLIPLLEWADREGVTIRNGDRRTLRSGMGA